MFGRVRISVEVAKEAIVCPVDAVIRSRTGNYVLVQRMAGKYENRRVKLGLTENNQIEVLDGVFPGDQVVVVGNSLLAALLGNEHKARVESAETQRSSDIHQGVVAEAHGSVELPTDQQALVTPQIEGRVRRILVQPGQRVAQGDILVEIESIQLRTVQLDLLQTLTQAKLIEQSLIRLEGLYEEGFVAKRQRWELQSEHQSLRTKAETLERKLAYFGVEQQAVDELKQADLSQADSLAGLVQALPVRAPAAGWIVDFRVVPGQVVHPEESLFEIHNLSTVWVKGFVYERDADRVQLGQPAHVHFAAYPHLTASGKVVRISPLMHQRMHVLPVWVEVSNPNHLLKSGMLARMTIMDGSAGQNDSDDVAQLQSMEPNR
jgi:cobalt-zinc-cadmium efflux system membrane fusion protein